MSKHYIPQKPSTVASDFLARHNSDALNAYYRSQGQKSYSTTDTNNTFNTLSPEGIKNALSKASKAWEDVQKLNEQIESTDDELLKSSLRQEKNAICKEQEKHLLSCSYMTQDKNLLSDFGNYRVKFFHADEDGEFSKIMTKYGHFRPENELDNVMILEIKNTYEGLKEKINQFLIDRNISEEKQEYLWKCMLPSYNELLEKSKTYEQSVKSKQDTILKQMSLSTADHYYQTLERDHKKEIEGLKFKSNQLVKQFKAQGLSMLGQLPEESEMILEIKDIIGGFKDKIDKNLNDNNIHNKIKSDVFKLFKSKLDPHLNQLKEIEKYVKQTEERLIYANNLEGFKTTQGSLRTYQQKIVTWKLESDKLTEEMTNKAIKLSYKSGQVQSTSNQELLGEIAKLNEKLAQLQPQQHPSFEGLTSIANQNSESHSEPSLEEYNHEAQSLLEQNIDGDEELNNKKNDLIKEIMDKLPTHPSMQQIHELKQELDYIRAVLAEQHDEEPNDSLASSMDGYDAELKDYYDGFVNEFNNAFTSSQAIFGGGIKLDATKPIGESIATSIAEYGSRLIPIVGDAIATGIKTGSTYKAERKLKENCNNLNKFGVSTIRLDKIAKYLAKKVIDNDDAKPTIKGYVPPATGNVKKFLDKINIKDEDSNQEKLGHIHAQKVLKEYIYNGKFKTLPLDSGNPVKKLLLDWMTDEFKKDDINEQAENNLPNLIDEVIVQAEEELANAPLLSEGQGVIGGQIQSMQQPIGQLQSVGILPVDSDEEDLTPRTMRKMIKELKTKNNQLQDENSNKDVVIQEKNNLIEHLETNPYVDPEKFISRQEVKEIMDDNIAVTAQIKNEHEIIVEQKDNIIQQINEESLAKDVLLEERDNTIKDQIEFINIQQKENIELTNSNILIKTKYDVLKEKFDVLKEKFDVLNDEHKEAKETIKDLRQDKLGLVQDKIELKEQLKDQKELTEKFKFKSETFKVKTQEKDIEITELQKIIDELKEHTQIFHISDHHSQEQNDVEANGQASIFE